MGKGKRLNTKGSRKSVKTQTSAFGVSRREGHDASAFYSSKMYEPFDLDKQTVDPHDRNELPAKAQNRVIQSSSENMRELPDNCVHLMVTSPPYNCGKEYDADLSLADYLGLVQRVCNEVYRILVPGGRACINIANVGRKPYIPLHFLVTQVMLSVGFWMRGEIIWDKGASAGGSCAWGSWQSPSNPTLRDVHEYILVFSKGAPKRKSETDSKATVSRDDFLECTKSIWRFPTVSAKHIGHPAPFPVELPRRLIELYTYKDDVVLDPFTGSGQTGVAAVECRRRFVGYDIEEEYVHLAQTRIDECFVRVKKAGRNPK